MGSPYEINTPYTHVHSFYAVSYQPSLNFHNTSKSVVLAKKKKTKKIHHRCHPRCYPNTNHYNNGEKGFFFKTENSRNRRKLENDVIKNENLALAHMDRLHPYFCQL